MILITGGMGFIGLHTARRLLDAGEEVVLTQFRARREPAFLKHELDGRAKVEHLDIADGAAVRDVVRRHRVTGIVHLAFSGPGSPSPAGDYRGNIMGLLNLLEAAQEAGVGRITLASSNAVYGGLPEGPYHEDARLPVESRNEIEAFKKGMEVLAFHYADRAGMDVVALRISAVYGPAYHSMRNLPSRLCHAAARGAAPDLSPVFGRDPHADDDTDLVYAKDCAAAIQLVQTAGKLPHRIYNVGGGRAVSNGELASAVNKAVPGAKIALPPGRSAPPKPNNYMDLSRIRRDAGYEPRYDVERGVAEYIAWLRDNPR